MSKPTPPPPPQTPTQKYPQGRAGACRRRADLVQTLFMPEENGKGSRTKEVNEVQTKRLGGRQGNPTLEKPPYSRMG